jgi:glycosyltransferase involved in cell wall biosynthesis
MASLPSCTVAICTLNRRDDLEIALESLRGQEAGPDWDILVVDNGSEDATAEYVESVAEGFPVPITRSLEPERGLSIARNRALREARGEIIIFVDDDVRCRPGWLAAHRESYDDPLVVATGGRIVPTFATKPPPWLDPEDLSDIAGPVGRCEHGEERQSMGPETSLGCFLGGNMGMRRAAAQDAGGFRTDLGWGKRWIPGEETELMKRLMTPGQRAWYLPEATLEHRVDASRLTLAYLKKWNLGYGHASIIMRRPFNPLSWLGKVCEQTFNLARFSPALLMTPQFVRLRTHRKFYQAIGRLAELMHL